MAYETTRNDIEIENIEVDEPTIVSVQSERARFKQEMEDPLYTDDYLETTPRRKSPTKRQSATQSLNSKLTVGFFNEM